MGCDMVMLFLTSDKVHGSNSHDFIKMTPNLFSFSFLYFRTWVGEQTSFSIVTILLGCLLLSHPSSLPTILITNYNNYLALLLAIHNWPWINSLTILQSNYMSQFVKVCFSVQWSHANKSIITKWIEIKEYLMIESIDPFGLHKIPICHYHSIGIKFRGYVEIQYIIDVWELIFVPLSD